MIKDIPGHAKGQIGILLTEHNLFFAADSCWNSEWINNSLTPLGRFLQNDYTAYLETLQKIQKMREDDLTVVFSHEEVQ
ncbi:hypothetical protein FACS189418_1760 [Clostridia bacterium]|nr:hypothetical protein FACS189418_1760 [Clostridia bacterium]